MPDRIIVGASLKNETGLFSSVRPYSDEYC
jgi:hypothetical protein